MRVKKIFLRGIRARPPHRHRTYSDPTPGVLRSFFDCSSIVLRFLIEELATNYRRTTAARSDLGRRRAGLARAEARTESRRGPEGRTRGAPLGRKRFFQNKKNTPTKKNYQPVAVHNTPLPRPPDTNPKTYKNRPEKVILIFKCLPQEGVFQRLASVVQRQPISFHHHIHLSTKKAVGGVDF